MKTLRKPLRTASKVIALATILAVILLDIAILFTEERERKENDAMFKEYIYKHSIERWDGKLESTPEYHYVHDGYVVIPR